MTIVPPVATAVMNRATRNALNQGENEDRMPAPACTPTAIMSGNLRPILRGKTGNYYILDCGRASGHNSPYYYSTDGELLAGREICQNR